MVREIDYESGDRVYVIDPSFEDGVVAEGIVEQVSSETVDVLFESDPMDSDDETERSIRVAIEQVLHVDADEEEVYTMIGLEHLLSLG